MSLHNVLHSTSITEPRPQPQQKVFQSCLSTSWGGLEMVAYETALFFAKSGIECLNLCIENSPLHEKLKAAQLPVMVLQNSGGIRDILRVRQMILSNRFDTVLAQKLSDLRMISFALIDHPEIRTYAIAHTFVNIHKKDPLHRWVYNRVHKLICLTELHKTNLLEHLPLKAEQLEILPNYVDCNRFHSRHFSEPLRRSLGAVDNAPLVGIASRLDPQKGQDCAIRALAVLRDRKIRVQLVLVGENTRNEGNYEAELKNLVKTLQLEDQVIFAGHREDMEAVMASLDILLLPSLCETFGRVLIEAMASKTPVIATAAGGVPNIIENRQQGLLVPPNEPTELAVAMETMIKDSRLTEQIIENAYFKVKTFYAADVVESRLKTLLEN